MLSTYKEVSENSNPRFKRYEHGEVWIGQDGNSRCYLLKTRYINYKLKILIIQVYYSQY